LSANCGQVVELDNGIFIIGLQVSARRIANESKCQSRCELRAWSGGRAKTSHDPHPLI
jgi:hypothetical protein